MDTQSSTPESVSNQTRTEEFKLSGDDIVAKIKELVHEGNVRRIIVRDETGRNVVEFPLTAGVIGVALLPVWAALGTIVALAANYTIVVERKE